MNYIKKIFIKGQYALYSEIAEKVSFFILFAFLSRKLEVAAYGKVLAVFAFSNILSSFFEFGFPIYFQREASYNNENLLADINVASFFKILLYPLFLAVSLFYFRQSSAGDFYVIAIISTSIYLFSINTIYAKTLYGKNLFKEPFLAVFASRSLMATGLVLFLIPFFNTNYIFILVLISGIIQYLILIKFMKKTGLNFKIKGIDYQRLKSIMLISLPMGLGTLLVWLYDKLDILLIQNIISPQAVAVYTVAYSIYKLPQIVSGTITAPLFTELSYKYNTKGGFHISDFIFPAFILTAVSSLFIIFIFAASKIILTFAYGARYTGSYWVLNMLVVALPGLFLNNFTGTILNAIRRERLVLLSTLFAFIINIVINLSFLKTFGISAAIAATIAAEYSILIFQLIVLYRHRALIKF